MPVIKSNGIDIAYEIQGELDQPIILMVHGLSMSIPAWPPAFLRHLRNAGFTLILFVFKNKFGLKVTAPYQLVDMKNDALGLLDALGVEKKVHVLGVSMGGMIAQLLAIHNQDRLLSLTSIMSTSGEKGLPSAKGPCG